MITVTDTARNKFLQILESEDRSGHGMRVTAKRGASPLSVDFGLVFVAPGEEQESDKVIEDTGFKIHIDPESAQLLDGALVDYVSGLNESGFKVTNPKATSPPMPSGSMADKIQHVIDAKVNPAIQSHGGVVSLVDVKEEIAYLRFGGGCQGCGMVDVTLKQGVEVMLKEAVPDLKQVMDVTDHADGKNPYYQPGK